MVPNIKKKKKFLTYDQRLKVIEKLKSGVLAEKVCVEYDISRSLCNKLWNCEEEILRKVNQNCIIKHKKISRPASQQLLDSAVIQWFQQARDRGDPVSGPILQEKALLLHKKLQLTSKFTASNGWLDSFKKRYGLKKRALKGEKLSNDLNGAADFSQFLKEKIHRENLSLKNIYNADESGIYWKTLMNYTLAQSSDEVAGSKERKDRFTALFCANASGEHRIPLLIIGKSAVPRHLKNLITPSLKAKRLKFLQILNIIYTHQTSAWMDRVIFKLWYTEIFIPSVKIHQSELGISGKVILILDNAPSHPSAEELNSVDDNFEIVYLPPNVTAIIQPMDQGLISLTKKHYKKNLLRAALSNDEGTLKYLKEINLQNSIILLKNAWNSLKESTLNKVWKPLLGTLCIDESNNNREDLNNSIDEDSVTIPHEICDQISQVLTESESKSVENTRDLLMKWFDADDSDCGWEPLSEDNIVSFVTNGNNVATNVIDFEKDENSVESYISEEITTLPEEAFENFMKFKNWFMLSPSLSEHHACCQNLENVLRQHIEDLPKNNVYLRI